MTYLENNEIHFMISRSQLTVFLNQPLNTVQSVTKITTKCQNEFTMQHTTSSKAVL